MAGGGPGTLSDRRPGPMVPAGVSPRVRGLRAKLAATFSTNQHARAGRTDCEKRCGTVQLLEAYASDDCLHTSRPLGQKMCRHVGGIASRSYSSSSPSPHSSHFLPPAPRRH